MTIKIDREDFQKCAKELTLNLDIEEMETKKFRFIRVDEIVTVKFKGIDKLTGYFTMEEIKSPETLDTILQTLEKELEGVKDE